MPSVYNTKCIIGGVELLHDLNPDPIKKEKMKTSHFQENHVINYLGNQCSGLKKTEKQLFSELEFIKFIFEGAYTPSIFDKQLWWGNTIGYPAIFHCSPPPPPNNSGKLFETRHDNVTVVDDNTSTITFSKQDNVHVMTHALPKSGTVNSVWARGLTDLFHHKDYIFLVLDTGDDFVKTIRDLQIYNAERQKDARQQKIINQSTQSTQSIPDLLFSLQGAREFDDIPNVYQIHSAVTLADSARKAKPDAKNYETNNFQGVRLYSYFDLNSIRVRNNTEDPAFMTSFGVKTKLDSTIDRWGVRQTWSLMTEAPQVVTNPHKDNNKKSVKEELKRMFTNGTSPELISYQIQKKRSGDHLAIKYAKDFPSIVVKQAKAERIIFTRGPKEGATYGNDNMWEDRSHYEAFNHNDENEAKKWYKDRTYFITGDWPAFGWAVMNKVNVIIIYRLTGQKYAIRVYFDD